MIPRAAPIPKGFSGLVCVLMMSFVFAGCGPDPSEADSTSQADPSRAASPEAVQQPDDVDSNEENVDDSAVRIIFLGDSITAGYGIDQPDAFPARVETHLTERGYNVFGIDAGVSGDTSTGGLNRLDWLLQQRVDILVLELGGNDGLRGIDLSLTRSNLARIIEQTREAWPGVDIVLVGMRVPPNLGIRYTEEFATMYPELADEYRTAFVPFIGEDFEDVVHLLQNDGIHPTEEGHALIADRIEEVVEPLVARRTEAS